MQTGVAGNLMSDCQSIECMVYGVQNSKITRQSKTVLIILINLSHKSYFTTMRMVRIMVWIVATNYRTALTEVAILLFGKAITNKNKTY